MKKLSTVLMLFVLNIFVFVSAGPSHAIDVTFTDLNAQWLGNIWTSGPASTVGTDFDILNDTDVTWTDFHFDVYSPFGGNAFFSLTDPYVGPGTATVDITPPSTYGSQMDVIGLNIPDGSTYSSTVGVIFGEAAFAAVYGYPTIDVVTPPPDPGAPVPEPATMLLFGTGLAGLAGAARRKKAQKK